MCVCVCVCVCVCLLTGDDGIRFEALLKIKIEYTEVIRNR